jgi:hypothetical protein
MKTQKISSQLKRKIKKFEEIAQELYQGKYFDITRLTTLKSLCKDSGVANKFVFYFAVRTQEKMNDQEKKYISPEKWNRHKELVNEAIEQMEKYIDFFDGTPEKEKSLRKLLDEIIQLQNTYENQDWGPVRLIESSETLLVEKALRCILEPGDSSYWSYRVGRLYAERYNPRYGTGLIPESAPLIEDIALFWIKYYQI